MINFLLFLLASLFEIGGCFAFWACTRLGASRLWLAPGLVSLALFALVLTRVESSEAGRAYAAYGAVYIASAIVWMWLVERHRPDRWDVIGTAICLCGSVVILLGPRVHS